LYQRFKGLGVAGGAARKTYGSLSTKTANGASGIGSGKGGSSLITTTGTIGVGGAAGIGSSSGGDKTPVKKKVGSGSTSSGSGVKKGEQSFSSTTKSITSGSGSVIGGAGSSGIG
jgi:hypothetical protein